MIPHPIAIPVAAPVASSARYVMTGGTRVTPAQLDHLASLLSERDVSIVLDLGRLAVLTGSQLTRLHFVDLSPSSRDRTRRRVLGRLADLHIVATLERRIGGVRAGSSGLVYALGVAGQRLLPLLDDDARTPSRARRAWTPGLLFLRHSLDISELFVRLRAAERRKVLDLGRFAVEAAAWHPTGFGGVIKPDASLLVRNGTVEDSWWIEVDRATESLPTLRRKLLAYVDFANAGQLGPDGVIPRVLVTVPSTKRLEAISGVIASLPEPAEKLVSVELHDKAVGYLAEMLEST